MKHLIHISILLIIFFSFATSAFADVAPPEAPPGSNLIPGYENTMVRMMSETVLLDVQASASSGGPGKALVTAKFTMQNIGTESESMAARFPISANDGFYNYPEITDLQVAIDGNIAGTRRIPVPDSDEELHWAEFDITFPPGQDVQIEVSYSLKGTGEYPFISFAYLLETGAGWQGTIGSVDLVVRLPYEANEQNVFLDSSPGWGQTSTGAILSGREVLWHYDDLEPARKDNLSIVMVMPSAWETVLTEQTNVAQNGNDGEAWGRLGKIYKETSLLRRGTRYDAGGLELFLLSVEAYEKAVTLLPNDALWHAGFADLLFERYFLEEYSSAEKPGMLQALQELSRAYELNQNEPFILNLLDTIHYAVPEALSKEGDNYVFQWLTATPTFQPSLTPEIMPSATAEPSHIAIPTKTPEAEATPIFTQTPNPQSEESSPRLDSLTPLLVFGAALLIIMVFLFMRKRM